MKMIPNVRGRWHRLWSMRFAIVTAFLSGAMGTYAIMPTDWTADIPKWIIKICAVCTFLSAGLTGVSRVISQPKLKSEDKHEGGE